MSNANIKHIKKQLSFATKQWSFLENEFDSILQKIERAYFDIKNMSKMS